MRWDVFIAHAGEDKNTVARPLAKALQKKGLRVWFDEFTLIIGDHLRKKIDEGLRDSTYGVVILSEAFFAKAWPQDELDGLFARERNGIKVILPVWHKLTFNEIEKYSPILAGRLAGDTKDGIDKIVDMILKLFDDNVAPIVIPIVQPVSTEIRTQSKDTITASQTDEKILFRDKFALHLSIGFLSFLFSELLAYYLIYFTKNFVWGIEISFIIFAFSYLFLWILWDFVENLPLKRFKISFSLDKIKIHLIIYWVYWVIIYSFGIAFYKYIFAYSIYSTSYIYGFTKDMVFYALFVIPLLLLYHFSIYIEESAFPTKLPLISRFEKLFDWLVISSIFALFVIITWELNYFNFKEFLDLPSFMQGLAQIHVVIRAVVVAIIFALIYLHYYFVKRRWSKLNE